MSTEDRFPAVTLEEAEVVAAELGLEADVRDYMTGCVFASVDELRNRDTVRAKNAYIFGLLGCLFSVLEEDFPLATPATPDAMQRARSFFAHASACERTEVRF